MKIGRVIAFLFVVVISPAAYGQTTYIVGDTSGWDSNVNYANWARGRTFTVGDSLVFNYDFSHAVDEVSSDAYTNCLTAKAISSDSSSPTTVSLTAAGTRYFVCPRSNHCNQQGQTLTTNVVAPTATTPSPPSSDTPAPPTTTTPSSPPPPEGSSATSVGVGKSFLISFLFLLLFV